jgi:Chaperone of endosialidase
MAQGEFRAKIISPALAATFVALLSVGGVAHATCYQCTFQGTNAGNNASGFNNSGFGFFALGGIGNSSGDDNTAIGAGALQDNTTGDENTAAGLNALESNTTGEDNTAVGRMALSANTTGSGNIALGSFAGHSLTIESNDIDIGNEGIAGDSGVIRIGTKGTQTRAVIAGISSAPIYGSPVFVNVYGRLGIQASSARFKRDIRDMGEASDRLMKLRPVTFRYKEDPAGTLQYGLVAEEVARVYPELVTYGDDGKPLSVAYHLLPAMLLNELQKQTRENERQAEQIGRLTTRIAEAEANSHKKDRQIAILVTQIGTLRNQATQIDSLTARLTALENQSRPERVASANH